MTTATQEGDPEELSPEDSQQRPTACMQGAVGKGARDKPETMIFA